MEVLTLFERHQVGTHWSIDWQVFCIRISQMVTGYQGGISILVDILKETPVTPAALLQTTHPPLSTAHLV